MIGFSLSAPMPAWGGSKFRGSCPSPYAHERVISSKNPQDELSRESGAPPQQVASLVRQTCASQDSLSVGHGVEVNPGCFDISPHAPQPRTCAGYRVKGL